MIGVTLFRKIRLLAKTAETSELFTTYLKILCIRMIQSVVSIHKRSEKIFGYTVYFFNYDAFLSMFEDIFIEQVYQFSTNKKNPIIIDGGTNIGVEILYYKKLYPASKILAFEPDKKTYRFLKKTVVENKFQNVTVVNAALSSNVGQKSFHVNRADQGSLVMGFMKRKEVPHTVRTKTVRLPDYITEKIDFLKLDIEGAEGDVIKNLSMTRALRKISQITVEFHHNLNKQNDLISTLLLLKKNGFNIQLGAEVKTPPSPYSFQNILLRAYRK